LECYRTLTIKEAKEFIEPYKTYYEKNNIKQGKTEIKTIENIIDYLIKNKLIK
jgi:hypothetical protein